MAVELDEVDVRLLPALLADAVGTNVELPRPAGPSPAATLHPGPCWLKESGVIRVIAAQLDPAAAGFPLQVYVTASLARHDLRSSHRFEDHIRAVPQIITADNVAGETDYVMSVVARDVTELQQVLAGLATRGGQRLVTYLRLERVKPPSRLPLAPTLAAPGPRPAGGSRPARRAGRSCRRCPGHGTAAGGARPGHPRSGVAGAGERRAWAPQVGFHEPQTRDALVRCFSRSGSRRTAAPPTRPPTARPAGPCRARAFLSR